MVKMTDTWALLTLKRTRSDDRRNWRKIDGADSPNGVRMVFKDVRKYLFEDEGSQGATDIDKLLYKREVKGAHSQLQFSI